MFSISLVTYYICLSDKKQVWYSFQENLVFEDLSLVGKNTPSPGVFEFDYFVDKAISAFNNNLIEIE